MAFLSALSKEASVQATAQSIQPLYFSEIAEKRPSTRYGTKAYLSNFTKRVSTPESGTSWYSRSSSCFLLNGSRFPVSQGVRRSAILSPLLYSVFVDDLLAQLHQCGIGAIWLVPSTVPPQCTLTTSLSLC